jgi:hypothetical protein
VSTPEKPVFTAADADALLRIAHSAPIPGGMPEAQHRSELFGRFATWFQQLNETTIKGKAR